MRTTAQAASPNFSKRPRRCEDLAMDTTTTEKGDAINNDDFLMRDWEQKELRNIDQLKKERAALCERFAKAETWDKKYRIILDFAARQDSPRSHHEQLAETRLTCIPEKEMPPLFRVCCEELRDAGMLRFTREERSPYFPEDPTTTIVGIIHGTTYQGRLELARLKREIYQRSWRYKLKSLSWLLLPAIVGAVLSPFIAWLYNRLLGPVT